MKLIRLLIVIILLGSELCYAEVLDGVAAIVNDNIITIKDLEKQKDVIRSNAIAKKQDLSLEEINKLALNNLIDQKVQLTVAEKLNINVNNKEVSEAINAIASKRGMTLKQFKAQLKGSGESYQGFFNFIKSQLIITKLQKTELAKKVTITPREIKSYREKKQLSMQKLYLIDWLFEVESDVSSNKWRRVKTKSLNLLRQLKLDASLVNSDGATKHDLGWRSLDSLPVVFVSNLKAAKESVVGPIKAPNGYHVLQIKDRQKKAAITYDQAANMLYFQKVQRELPIWLKTLKQQATIEIVAND